MGEVIKFGGENNIDPPEPMVWQCDSCGSQNFFLYDDGSFECSFCNVINDTGYGDWQKHTRKAPDNTLAKAAITTSNPDDIDFGKARTMRKVGAETNTIIIIQNDGGMTVWSETNKKSSDLQKDWLFRQLNTAGSMVLNRPSPVMKDESECQLSMEL